MSQTPHRVILLETAEGYVANDNYYFFDVHGYEKIMLSEEMIWGRSDKCDFVIPDDGASGQHMKVRILDGQIYVTDLGSRNKTILNGRELEPNKEVPVNPKDVIQICDQEYSVSSHSGKRFDLPDLSHSNINILEDNTGGFVDRGFDAIQKEQAEIEAKEDNSPGSEGGLKGLRKAKRYIQALTEALVEIDLYIKQVFDMQDERGKILRNIRDTETKISKATHQKVESCKKDITKHEVERDSHAREISAEKNKIAEAEKLISAATARIETQDSQIALLEVKISTLKENHGLFDQLVEMTQEGKILEHKIKALKDMNLKNKKEGITKEIKSKEEDFKNLQSQFGEDLQTGKKKKGPKAKLSLK
ncbi:MAG: FHA domain-containing protein [Halobacteriovoraceae bacterium]|nr:FHA domain-containing protein [Halobacteriovoraceae bacterium]